MKNLTQITRSICLPAAALLTLAGSQLAFAQPIADIEVLAVSPRQVAEDPNDVFDAVTSGLNVVGLNAKTYLQAHPDSGATISGYQWELSVAPGGSSATLSANSGELVTFAPDEPGKYVIKLTPLDGSMNPTESVEQTIFAAAYVGVGVFAPFGVPDTTIPSCANVCCHAESDQERLNVVDEWMGSGHADKLTRDLNGNRGFYSTSCLECHSLGYNPNAENNGFDDIATEIMFDLNNIPTWATDGDPETNFADLPQELQSHANIQCESCHGPGAQHLGYILEDQPGIAGVDFGTGQCAQCHDSASGHQQGFYQWTSSQHALAADAAHNTNCTPCHTAEGFVAFTVNGETNPDLPEHPNGITCSGCHDPHNSDNEHQLRLVGDTEIASGDVLMDPGKGGLCVNCHHSRVADAEVTSVNSFRGAHHGPQSDMFLGTNAVEFGLAVYGNSAHTTIVDDSCVRCHMAEGPGDGLTPPLVGEHTFEMRDTMGTADPGDDVVNAENACSACHPSLLTSYDYEARGDYDGDGTVEGVQSEVEGLFDLLRPGLLALPGTSLGSDGTISISSGNFAMLTAEQKKARYNYNFVWEDGSFGVHNTSYAVQILQRTYGALYGKPITDDYPNVDLRGPVQPTTLPTPTPTPTPTTTPTPFPTPVALAKIELMGVSPRTVDTDMTGIFDEVYSGLNAVGVGQKVYMEALQEDQSVTGYSWAITMKPNNSMAMLSDTTGELVTFRPDIHGVYEVTLTAQTTRGVGTTDQFVQRIYAANYVGAGTFDGSPIAPQCGTGFCHGPSSGNPALRVRDQWLDSAHANKLQNDMAGVNGHYAERCLPCHTVGYNTHPEAMNNGFDDIATQTDIDNLIAWTNDADPNTNFEDLPGTLQNHGSIQCENCHGAGDLHPPNLFAADNGIDGVDLGLEQCAQCHDSSSGFQQGFYQWGASAHPLTADASEGHVTEIGSCLECHTGEGFVAVHDNGLAPPTGLDEYHGVTCSTCHDPHGSENNHALRVVGDYQIPNGSMTYGAGDGGLCFRCHHSRRDDPESTAVSSFRGAHHGPQADMILNSGGVGFGLEFEGDSPHLVSVEDTCVHCHMAEPTEAGYGITEPPLVGGHTFAMRDEMGTPDNQGDDVINVENACQTCHFTLDTFNYQTGEDFDGDGTAEGVQEEIRGLLYLLQPGLLAMPGMSLSSDGTLSISSGDFANLTDDQKRARYNYNFVVDDGSYGVHNTAYTVQLLQRAYFGVYGRSIIDDFPNIDTRGPVQPATGGGADEVWLISSSN